MGHDEPELAHHERPSEKWVDTAGAQTAFTAERSETFIGSIKKNKRAVMWSLILSTAIIMEGYDTSLLPSFYGYPSFQKHYGEYYPDIDGYQLSGPWQAGLSNGVNVGVIFGGFINGWASNRFGYKKTMTVAMTFMAAALFVVFFSPNVVVLLVGEILCGLPWGVFATSGPAYASEVCPMALRAYLTVYCNLCWAMGQLIANGVLQGLVTNTTSWGYRIPWAIQWVWPPILIFGCIFAPESPWWLVRNNRLAEAEKTLARLTDADSDKLKAMVSQMLHTIEIEREIESGSSYWHCFKGVDLRRTEICCFAWATQMLSGAQFAYGPSYFFLQAGMDTEDAYKLAVGSPALGFLATALSWILLSYAGRRTIFLGGISTLAALLAIIGIIAAAASANNESALWAQASLCLVWQFVYSLTLGPMAYVIVSETSAVRLRAQSVVLARNFYNVTTVWAAVLEPYMIHPEEWNLKGKTAFVWCATSVIMTIWGFFRLPECGGRAYEEIDLLFANKVPARKFKSAIVDPYAGEGEQVKLA